MEYPKNSLGLNTLSLKQREIELREDEKKVLDTIVGERVAELFDHIDHTKTISTLTPIELDASPLSPPNGLFALIVRKPYQRAHVQATFEESGETSTLVAAQITLFVPGTPYIGELVIVPHEDNDEHVETDGNIGTMTHTFTSRDSPQKGVPIPLRDAHVKDFLDGLVTQGNQYAAITKPDCSVDESIVALLQASSDCSTERYAEYQMAHGRTDTTVLLNQITHVNGNGVSTIEDYKVEVKEDAYMKSFPEDTPCRTTVTCTHEHTPKQVSTILEAHYESPDSEGDIRGAILLNDLNDFNDTEQPTPSRFTSQILDGLELLLDKSETSEASRLY
jgi:hypothetical protein